MADPLRSPAPAQGLRIRPNQPTRSPPPLRESESEEERKDSKEGERPAFVTGRYRQLQGSSREGGFLGERGGAGRKEEEEEESLGESEDGEEGDELKGRSELNIELGEEGQGRGSVKFLKTVDSAPSLGFFTDSDTSSPRVPNLMSSSPTPQKAVSLAPEELKSTSTSPTSDITPTARRRKSSSVLLRSKTSVNLKKETTKEKEESTSSPSSVPPTPPASIGGGSKKQARSPILRGNKGKQREPLSPKVKMRNPPKKSLRKNRPCSSLGLLQYGRTSAPNLLDGGDMRNLTSSPSSPSSPSLDRGVMRRAGNADKGTQRELSLKMFEEESEDIRYVEENDGTMGVKAATVEKLFEFLTSPNCSAFFRKSFLLTYRSFTDGVTLLSYLTDSYLSWDEGEGGGGGGEGGEGDGTFPLRVMRVLKNWMNDFGYDFESEEEEAEREGAPTTLLGQLTHFCAQIEGSQKKNAPAHSALVRKSIQKIIKATSEKKRQSELFLEKELGGKGGADFPFNDLLLWGEVEVATFAGQITWHNFDTYSKITPKEIMHYVKAKSGEDKKLRCPNITKVVQQFNDLSSWATTMICKQCHAKNRVAVMSTLLSLLEKLFDLNNLHGSLSLLSTFSSSSVARLKTSFEQVDSSKRHFLEDVKERLSHLSSYKAYRAHIHSINPPLVPYIGVYLTDLTFINDGNPDLTGPLNLINFGKCYKVASVIVEMQQYHTPYVAVSPDKQIQSALASGCLESENETENYRLSKIIEGTDYETVIENLLKNEKMLKQKIKKMELQASLCSFCSDSPLPPSPSPFVSSGVSLPSSSSSSPCPSPTFVDLKGAEVGLEEAVRGL